MIFPGFSACGVGCLTSSRNSWSKPLPEGPDNPSDHFEPVSASPSHSQPILQQIVKLKTKMQKLIKNKMQRNVCKSMKNQLSCLFEGLGPLPNCRSHFSDLGGIDESSGNPLGASLVTKQCSEKTMTKNFLR